MEHRFLIVEDDHQNMKFIKFSLGSQGYECLEAATGKQALEIMAVESITAIILDLGLPDIDGIDIIKRVRSFSDIPIREGRCFRCRSRRLSD